MLPRHLNNVPDKTAVAPYNFVELPNDIIEIKPESLPQENSYDFPSEKRYTGRIECTLTTKSPLYIRCGLTKEEFECDRESKNLSEFFYTQLEPKAKKPVLPGSSLRGMLRSIVEIISFSKIDRVSDANLLKINDDAVQHYRSALTDFQKQEPPFDQEFGVLQPGLPIFYCEPQNEQTEVTLFGHSPNFRIPYSPNQDGKAASAVDFIPKKIGKSNKIDLAEAIFGFIRAKDKDAQENTDEETLKSLAGRVFIENAICEKKNSDDIWLTGNINKTVTLKILSTPKPTTFQHYLVQTNSYKSQLKHYASKPSKDNDGETVIRGHKLYWHKKSVAQEDIEEQDITKIRKVSSQYTQIKPIKSGVSFNFCIHFENLNEIELGALLWVLKIAANHKYSLSLGMGKPLGMGAVKIKHELYLSNRESRYSLLFNSNNRNKWLTGEEEQTNTASQYTACIEAFEKYITENIHEDDHPKEIKATKLEDIPRIQMLLAMLCFDIPPENEETRYMTIEPNNEYTERPVLPTPLQIKEIKDDRKFSAHSRPSQKSSTTQFEKPQKDDRAKNYQRNKSRPNSGDGNNYNPAMQRPRPPKK